MLHPVDELGQSGRLAMIDSGCTPDWKPSEFIRRQLGRTQLDYLFITNADQDHLADLDGLWDEGVYVESVFRNQRISVDDLRRLKLVGGTPTNDIERYLKVHTDFTAAASYPFDQHMGGIRQSCYGNGYPQLKSTNDLSLAVFIQYGSFKILFPGDLERDGWLALLEGEQFRKELAGVTVLVASHHGRANGYCAEVFDYCHPMAVVISDKAIEHDTQWMAQTYRARVTDNYPNGVLVNTTMKRRHVLTTRRDGWIQFDVTASGGFDITTEYRG
jgi:beta-lactamase superfamily II metal-dependent hydrolase